MNSDTEYTFLIAFVIFLAIKNLVAIIVHAKFPTYENLDKASTFWKIIVKMRSVLNLLSLLFSAYFLYNYRFTPVITLIFWMFLIRSIYYFVIDERYIWLFINETPETVRIVRHLNIYGDSISHSIVTLLAVYALAKIFAPK